MVMDQTRKQRLKPLLDKVPPGFVVDTRWLKTQSIDPKSIHDYVSRGWLERVVRGVYRRPVPEGVERVSEVSWEIALLSLQRIMEKDVHLGGETALEWRAIPITSALVPWRAFISTVSVPAWLHRIPTQTKIVVHRRTLLGDDPVGIGDSSRDVQERGLAVNVWRWTIRSSSPERAILEALDELPNEASFDSLGKIFEALTTMRPELLTTLLAQCRSIKVRRLFFWLQRTGTGIPGSSMSIPRKSTWGRDRGRWSRAVCFTRSTGSTCRANSCQWTKKRQSLIDERYVNQVRLLLRVLPDIAAEDVFALKGGTAINLFYREMPRLSVDIDLAYLPVDEREKSLQDIDETLDRIVAAISERNPGVEVNRIPGGGNNDTRILVREGAVRVKIETSPVTRGTVYAPVTMKTSDAVTEHFGFVETRVSGLRGSVRRQASCGARPPASARSVRRQAAVRKRRNHG